jgi:hypothetical protein
VCPFIPPFHRGWLGGWRVYSWINWNGYLSLTCAVKQKAFIYCDRTVSKGEVVPAHAVKAYRESGGIASLILKRGDKWIYRVSQELRSLLRDIIPELFLSEKCRMYRGPIRNGSGVMSVTRELLTLRSTAVVRKVRSSLVTRVRKGFQADVVHFEQLAWMLNSESITVHLTTYFNKCTLFLFFFKFIYCTLKTHKSWIVANWIHV